VARQQAFGMRGAVTRWHVAILGLDQHGAVSTDQNGAERVIAAGYRAAGDLERAAQKMRVTLRRAEIRDVAHAIMIML
jgi:hypothetical protein